MRTFFIEHNGPKQQIGIWKILIAENRFYLSGKFQTQLVFSTDFGLMSFPKSPRNPFLEDPLQCRPVISTKFLTLNRENGSSLVKFHRDILCFLNPMPYFKKRFL